MFKSFFVLTTTIIIFTFPALAHSQSFEGVWQTTFGRMRLVSNKAGHIEGVYAYQGLSQISGTVSKTRMTFMYTESNANGQGWFEIAADGQSFEGEWQQQGADKWNKWTGKLINPMKNTSWLIVLEAGWDQSLEDRELSFGDMLKTFFSHNAEVLVRHRYFSDVNSFKRMLNEVIFLPEPTVITIAAHGAQDGILTEQYKIGPKIIAENLSYASSVRLLHFSSCLVMKDSFGKDIVKNLPQGSKFPVSGYKTSVDWIASAVFEFMYFDLILNRDTPVKQASSVITKLMPFGGSKQVSGSPFKSMDFDIQLP